MAVLYDSLHHVDWRSFVKLPPDPCRMLGGHRAAYTSPPLNLDNLPSRDQMIKNKVYYHGGIEQILAKKGREPGPGDSAIACRRRRAEASGLPPSVPYHLPPRFVEPRPKQIFELQRNGIPFASFTNPFEAFINRQSLNTQRTRYDLVVHDLK